MKKLLMILTFGLVSFGANAQKVESKAYDRTLNVLLTRNVDEVSVQQAAQLQQKGKTVFLDARQLKEYNVSHIKEARWIGYDAFNANKIQDIPKNTQIIVYCSVGYRSEKITEQLTELGYKNVSNMYGGIFEWVNQNNKVYNNDNQVTLKVHTYNRLWSRWLKRGVKVY